MVETDSATVSENGPETATWTRFLPEAFGIRENVQNSPFRWCVREVRYFLVVFKSFCCYRIIIFENHYIMNLTISVFCLVSLFSKKKKRVLCGELQLAQQWDCK